MHLKKTEAELIAWLICLLLSLAGLCPFAKAQDSKSSQKSTPAPTPNQSPVSPATAPASTLLGPPNSPGDQGPDALSASYAPAGQPNSRTDTGDSDLFTGSFSTSLPLKAPPGRNGMTPDLMLIYRSVISNGWVGVGWTLNPGTIERNRRYSLDYDKDGYVLNLAGGSVELTATGNGEYRARIEQSFLRIKKRLALDHKTYWEVTDKEGNKYFFGQSTRSRQDDDSDQTRIFGWSLDEVEDTHGNSMTYYYSKDQGQIYLDSVEYVRSTQLHPTHFLKFYLTNRGDVSDSYATKFRVRTAFRLNSIGIFSAGKFAKGYKLTYSESAVTTNSLLNSVQEYGSDAEINDHGEISGGTSLPARTFGWPDKKVSFGGTINKRFDLDPARSQFQSWADFNGDGREDLVQVYGTANNQNSVLKVSLSLGNKFADEITSPVVDWGSKQGRGWADFNGDGKADYCRVIGNANLNDSRVRCTISTGQGFGNEITSPVIDWGDEEGRAWVDVNGDGKADYCRVVKDSNGQKRVKCIVSNGDGFAPEITSDVIDVGRPDGRMWADFDGDGKADYCRLVGSTNLVDSRVQVLRSNGNGFEKDITSPVIDWGRVNGRAWADFNGDGKSDYCRVEEDPNHTGNAIAKVLLSTGDGFGAEIHQPVDGSGFFTGREWADINGDGRADYCRRLPNNINNVGCLLSTGSGFGREVEGVRSAGDYLGKGWIDVNGDGKADHCFYFFSSFQCVVMTPYVSDLLTSDSNGLGATTSVTYKASSNYQNTQLPLSFPTVSSIKIDDGNGVTSTTNFIYSGGYYSITDREFRGFNYSKVVGPSGPAGDQVVEETWFHQGNDLEVDKNDPSGCVGFMKGKPYRFRTSDSNRRVFTEITTSYAKSQDFNCPISPNRSSFNPPDQVDTYVCDEANCGNGPHLRTRYAYDNYGNVVREEQFGDVGDPTDDRTIVREYSPNDNLWIVDLPIKESVYKGLGNDSMVSRTEYYYDGTNSCASPSTNRTPTNGDLTRIVRWLSVSTEQPEVRTAYDKFGNVACSRDPNGNETSFEYDVSRTYPTVVTNSVGQKIVADYYGTNENDADIGPYGQLKSLTNPNDSVSRVQYDPLGRITRLVLPDQSWQNVSYNNYGRPNEQNVQVDTSASLSSWTFFDGLSRTVRSRSSGPDGKIIVAQVGYDARGFISQGSTPYFEGIEQPKWTTFAYDPIGRIVQVNNPDNTRSAYCYNSLSRVFIDENGHRIREMRDAFGQMVSIQEYLGTFDKCSTGINVPLSSFDRDTLLKVLPNVVPPVNATPYGTTTYNYDVLGNLSTIEDAKGNRIETSYDTLGRKINVKDPDTGDWWYDYDLAGNLIKETDSKNQSIYYGYDSLNRLLQTDYGSKKSLGRGDFVYTYDADVPNGKGRLFSVEARDRGIKSTYLYDALGRIIKAEKQVGRSHYVLGASFDAADRIRSISYPDNSVVNYEYNGPFLSKIYDGQYAFATLSNINAFGQPLNVAYGNGAKTTYSYSNAQNPECNDDNYRLCTVRTSAPNGQILQTSKYDYDRAGNVIAVSDARGRQQQFVYDARDRLVAEGDKTGTLAKSVDLPPITGLSSEDFVKALSVFAPNVSWKETFTYDEIGNMTFNSNVGVYEYPRSGAGSTHPHAIVKAGGKRFAYDKNGNMEGGAGRSIEYDYLNRPNVIRNNGVTTTAKYDWDGQRYQKSVGNMTTTYIDDLYTCESDRCKKYVFAGGQRIAESLKGSQDYHFYHADYLGSTKLVTNGEGSLFQSLNYSTFGTTLTDSDDSGSSVVYKFTGQEFDESTDLYFFKARYYDPVLARFITPDSIVPQLDNPQTLNPYSYARNNPINVTDPTGRSPLTMDGNIGREWERERDRQAERAREPHGGCVELCGPSHDLPAPDFGERDKPKAGPKTPAEKPEKKSPPDPGKNETPPDRRPEVSRGFQEPRAREKERPPASDINQIVQQHINNATKQGAKDPVNPVMAAFFFLSEQRERNPTDPALAAAEHFMFAKVVASEKGLLGFIEMQVLIPGYDLAKEIAFMTGTEKALFGNPSRPSELARYWSHRGANEGLNENRREMTPLVSRPRREIFR